MQESFDASREHQITIEGLSSRCYILVHSVLDKKRLQGVKEGHQLLLLKLLPLGIGAFHQVSMLQV